MRKALAVAMLVVAPCAAQAAAMMDNKSATLACQSMDIFPQSGACEADGSLPVRLEFGEDHLMGTFKLFAKSVEPLTHAVRVQGAMGDGVLSYRMPCDLDNCSRLLRWASRAERANGWFGPELPSHNAQRHAPNQSYRVAHTRKTASDTSAQTKQDIVFLVGPESGMTKKTNNSTGMTRWIF